MGIKITKLILTRKQAFRFALTLLWIATGTSRIQVVFSDNNMITLSGKNLIEKNEA